MKICENCGTEHEGKFGSGRFCSLKCSRAFSTKAKRKEINKKVSKKLLGKSLSNEHKSKIKSNWNIWSNTEKGKKSRSEAVKKSFTPERRQKYSDMLKDKLKTDEFKKAISDGIHKSVEEGRWPGWKNRIKGDASFAEKYFMERFDEKNVKYEREYKINRFFVDFAFQAKKIVLEIDGKQHEYPERKTHDENRDKIIEKEGWKIYRIKWVKVGNNYEMYDKFLEFLKFLGVA